MRLKDKAIIVTGSTRGIGAAIARRFVKEGAKVLIHGLDQEEADTVAHELGETVATHVDDLTDVAAPQRIVAAAQAAFGRIDGIVNNAGLSIRSTLESTTVDLWDQLMAVNLRAPMLMVQSAVDALAQSEGVVLNIGSVLAHCGMPKLMAYSVTKGGLMTLTRNLALSLGPRKIRVNQLNVGWTWTENEHELQLSEGQPENWLETVPEILTPSGRLLMPDEVASVAVHWTSSESHPVSGAVYELEQFPIIGRMPLT